MEQVFKTNAGADALFRIKEKCVIFIVLKTLKSYLLYVIGKLLHQNQSGKH